MIVAGLIFLVLGWVFSLAILTYIGVVLLVIAAGFLVLGAVGRPMGGRKVWY